MPLTVMNSHKTAQSLQPSADKAFKSLNNNDECEAHMRILLSLLTPNAFLVAASHVTFQEVASHLEATFDQAGGGGACHAGAIQRILEVHDQDAHCEAFSQISAAIGEAGGDVLKASKTLILQSIAIEEPVFCFDTHQARTDRRNTCYIQVQKF